MKSKRTKMQEYDDKYGSVPKDYDARINWLYDTLKLDDVKTNEILQMRQNFLRSTYYDILQITMYELPEHTDRPRARLITKNDIINAAYGNNSFIHVYSVGARDRHEYLKMYMQEYQIYLEQLLCTPCDVEYDAFFKTPSNYNKYEIMMAEMGLDRPVSKPDVDNIAKAYLDSSTGNIWIDDITVIDLHVSKFYSVLPRVEIYLKFMNQLYNKHQYKNMIKRKDFTDGMVVNYFGG